MKACFSEVKVVNVDVRAAWYISTQFKYLFTLTILEE